MSSFTWLREKFGKAKRKSSSQQAELEISGDRFTGFFGPGGRKIRFPNPGIPETRRKKGDLPRINAAPSEFPNPGIPETRSRS